MSGDDNYYSRAAHRRLTRRRLLQGAAFGGAGLAVAATIGCGGQGGAKGEASPAAKSETPKRGGILRAVVGQQAPTYDPHFLIAGPSIAALGLYESLLVFDYETMAPMPNVITKWEYADPTTLVLHVRDGVKYYDKPPANGRLMNAEDIAYGLNRARTKDPQIPFYTRFQAIDSVQTPDAKTVRVNLKTPSAGILTYIGTESVVNRESIEALGTWIKDPRQAISVGPFMATDFQPNVVAKAVRNPNYWQAGKPYLDGIECTIIADSAALVAAYRTGDSDYGNFGTDSFTITETVKKQLEQSTPSIQILKTIQAYGQLFLMNNDRPPFNDVRVRRAVDLVTDRQQLVKMVYGGSAAPAGVLWDGYMPGYSISEKELLARPGYRQPKDEDIAEAKKLLAAAGYPNGMDLPADGSEAIAPLNLDPTTASVAQFAKAGIKLHIDAIYDLGRYLDLEQKGQNLFRARGIGAAAEPGDQLRVRLYSTSPRNYAHYKNAEIDRMIDQQDAILDTKQRQDLCVKIARQAMDDVPYAFTIWPWGYTVAQSSLRGVKLPAIGNARVVDWWKAA